MAILKHTTKIVIGIFMSMTLAAHASECESMPAAILIDHWIGELPKKAELKIYKNDGKFVGELKSVVEKYNIKFYQPRPEILPTLEIDFVELKATKLPIDANFILVLDNRIEYRFSELEPPKVRLGCRLEGKVNACSFYGGVPVMSAEFKCGKQIMQK